MTTSFVIKEILSLLSGLMFLIQWVRWMSMLLISLNNKELTIVSLNYTLDILVELFVGLTSEFRTCFSSVEAFGIRVFVGVFSIG